MTSEPPAPRARRKPVLHTGRTKKLLIEQGWICDVTEHWNPHAGIRRDLFNFIDVLAIRPGRILGVQVTSRNGVSGRKAKLASLDSVPAWIAAGGEIEIWGWYDACMTCGAWRARAKPGEPCPRPKCGKLHRTWRVITHAVTLQSLAEPV